jgi:hypothetical protein
MTTRGWNFAFDRFQMGRLTSAGLSVGQLDPSNLGVGPTTSHALDVRGPMTATLPVPTLTVFEASGGGTYDGRVQGGVESVADGEIQCDQLDQAALLLARGGLVDTTSIAGSGNAQIYSANELNPTPFDVWIMMTYKKRILGNVKKTVYVHKIFPLVTVSIREGNLTQEGGKNTQPVSFTFAPQTASKFPWGVAFSSTQGWYNNESLSYNLDADNPYACTTWIADGSATTFTTAFKPKFSTVTNGNTDNVYTKNGTLTAPTSHSTSTAVVTVAAAGSASDIWVAFYPTNAYTPSA